MLLLLAKSLFPPSAAVNRFNQLLWCVCNVGLAVVAFSNSNWLYSFIVVLIVIQFYL